uniref:Uncharacterized protein n=1 Tax=Anguilla anguilla TaxID=7936 RepID=A0A0E9PCF9_ANGAN
MPISLSTMLSGMESNVAKTELCGAVTQRCATTNSRTGCNRFFCAVLLTFSRQFDQYSAVLRTNTSSLHLKLDSGRNHQLTVQLLFIRF